VAGRRPTLLLTMGDPAGIGPEILVHTLAHRFLRREAALIPVGDPGVLERAARHARIPLRFAPVSPRAFEAGAVEPPRGAVVGPRGALPLIASSTDAWGSFDPGVPSAASGRCAARAIEAAADLAGRRRADAVVTAPISKSALRAAGYPYPGHTEFLGALAGAPDTRMLFVGGRWRILLATVHVALRGVSEALTAESLLRTLEYAALALRNFRWGGGRSIAVLGVNPHAGEDGLFGDEEARILGPAMEAARARGIRVDGPHPADTYFGRRADRRDPGVIVAMYHDQGLIPAKMDGIGSAANVTLGLPYVRSSVDHGTAFDRAWKGGARRPDPSGLIMASRVGLDLARRGGRAPLEWTWP
jgi:4-hydroxythreonine-4-phosphate dehydrogenase